MTPFVIDPGPLSSAFTANIQHLSQLDSGRPEGGSLRFADALWSKRLDVWTRDAQVQAKIANRLGWLDVLDFVTPQLGRLRALAGSIKTAGFTHVVLLGMGGSSLAPEVLHQVLGVAEGFPRFRMLDSTDPAAVRDALDAAPTSLFIVASKSGTTIEPNSMAAEAARRVTAAGHSAWGSRFIAITDENTALHRHALQEGFRDVFVNPADIGGRYSALSFFGLVPAAVMGADVDRLLASAREMEAACRAADPAANPGFALGALMAAGAGSARDKLTLLTPDALRSFGLWVEQLVAESTGKHGKGIVPITGEAADAPWSDDRVAVTVVLRDDSSTAAARMPGNAPRAILAMSDRYAIGAEFFRWEIATATAGLLLDINPFDEPNVQQAKDATKSLLDVFAERGQLPWPETHASIGEARLTLSAAAEQRLDRSTPTKFLSVADPSAYVGLLAYLPPDAAPFDTALRTLRDGIGRKTGRPTMFGYGPRYLHSTGQLHKGGANNGVFIVIVADGGEDLAIPDQRFSFGVLETAQALGDFQSLDRTGRRALLVRLPDRDPATLETVATALLNS